MAKERIRKAVFYVEAKKIAETESGTFEHQSGDEAQIGTDGYLGHSDGADMSNVELTNIIPVRGQTKNLKSILSGKRYVTVQVTLDGGIETIDMRCISRSYNSDSRSGKLTGQFRFEGGRPETT